ncbi:MAG: TIM barrel protein [Candidatus Latescibacteria bacterium]|nr:TIM barrel protein [Candidatus Latescibacterota bacterium]
MRLAIFTDEINRADPQRALRLAAEWGVSHVEIRSLLGGRFPQPSDAGLASFGAQVQDAGLAVSGVSPGFCKGPCDDPSVPRALAEGLPRACEWAQRWGTDLVSCFAFQRAPEGGPVPDQVVDLVGQMAATTRAHGCRLVLENEAVCWGATGTEAASLIRQLGADHLGLCWDPGNSARAGATCPYPDEYDSLKDLVQHVHLKNFDPATGNWSLAEQGTVNWPGQLTALQADGYDGFVVVETHLKDGQERDGLDALEANSQRNLTFLRTCLGLD